MRVINLFGGPGVGKSTTATGLQHWMKARGVNSEYADEDAKGAAWEKRGNKYFAAQQYIYGRQSWRLHRLRDEVDVIVTDCPLPLGFVYMTEEFHIPALRAAVMEDFNSYENLNVRLVRNKPYSPKGRNQTEEEAKQKDVEIANMLREYNIPHITLEYDELLNTHQILNYARHLWGRDVPALNNVPSKEKLEKLLSFYHGDSQDEVWL
jgi:nicotinamide riboside kinase